MSHLPWDSIVSFVVAFLSARYGEQLFANRHVRNTAKAILASKDHPTTDIGEAVREAWVTANHKQLAAQVDKLVAEQAAGTLRIAASVEAARAASAGKVETTIVAVDGSEVYRSPWKDKQP